MKQRVLVRFLLLFFAAVARVSAITFPDWQAANFTAAELADAAVSGADASPAGDGLSNLLKYAFDLDPHLPAAEGAPAPQFFDGALALNFLHRADASDLSYSLEASSNLSDWSLPNTLSPPPHSRSAASSNGPCSIPTPGRRTCRNSSASAPPSAPRRSLFPMPRR